MSASGGVTAAAMARWHSVALPVWALPAATFLIAFILLGIRAPEALLHAEFWADDGAFYSAGLLSGFASVLEPYGAFLVVGQRLVVLAETAVAPAWAPLIGNATQIALIAGLATYLACGRFEWPRRVGFTAAVLLVLAPVSYQLVGTLSHAIWPCLMFVGLVPLTTAPSSRAGRLTEAAALGLSAVTGPAAAMMMPLYLRGPRYRLVIVGMATLVGLAVYVLAAGSRPAPQPIDWGILPEIATTRLVVTPVIGPDLTVALEGPLRWAVGIILLVSIAVLVARTPRRWAIRMLYIALVPAAVAVFASGHAATPLLDPYIGPRYFWPATIIVLLLIAHSLERRDLAAVGLIALFAIGAAGSFRIEAPERMGWAESSRCIGGPTPCSIQLAPRDQWGWQVEWRP